ncbi:hypothetical protein [Pontivivens ytuae]|uniref:Uncharacterized protein n=1 Tax=Pontivivens ytuae TaxID=2789856 RepID=A0A7S9LVN7_9RHOB|nr:hypothetical protein [Pontivivens ytuae]QPH55840.1 hypothetical protein I0K15_09010 [Pontivivens ytuae]
MLAALPALHLELRPVFSIGHSQPTRMDAILSGSLPVGLSLDARKRILNLCETTLAHDGSWSRGPDARLALLRECDRTARRILVRNPMDGFAWLAIGDVAFQSGRADAMFAALGQSRAVAPGELWIASRRVRIGEQMLGWMDGEARAGHEADLLVVAQTPRGAWSLAHRYVSEPEFRERLVALVETLPQDDQIRFLRNVQRQSRAARGRS